MNGKRKAVEVLWSKKDTRKENNKFAEIEFHLLCKNLVKFCPKSCATSSMDFVAANSPINFVVKSLRETLTKKGILIQKGKNETADIEN